VVVYVKIGKAKQSAFFFLFYRLILSHLAFGRKY